jgi:hypothetical protein
MNDDFEFSRQAADVGSEGRNSAGSIRHGLPSN